MPPIYQIRSSCAKATLSLNAGCHPTSASGYSPLIHPPHASPVYSVSNLPSRPWTYRSPSCRAARSMPQWSAVRHPELSRSSKTKTPNLPMMPPSHHLDPPSYTRPTHTWSSVNHDLPVGEPLPAVQGESRPARRDSPGIHACLLSSMTHRAARCGSHNPQLYLSHCLFTLARTSLCQEHSSVRVR